MNMDGFHVGARLKAYFFDSAKVIHSVDATTRKALSAFGAAVRRAAIASIKEASGPSSPGQPPHSHVGSVRRRINRWRKSQGKEPIRGGFKGLKYILFGYEPSNKSVIIGPASNRTRSLTIPEILEYGRDPKRNIAARPFMGPVFEREQSKLPAHWAKAAN